MRNWGTVVAAFYIAIVAALSPVVGLVVLGDTKPTFDASSRSDWIGVAIWAGWALLLAGGPLLLLFVGVDLSRIKLRPNRHILLSALGAGLALSLLIFLAAMSVILAIVGDELGDVAFWSLVALWPVSWLVWTLVLWRMGERLFDPATRLHRWLVKGSVLELLVVVPSHIIVRERHDCCAPGITGIGIATGLAILLMSLGPGALFLYRARMRRIARPPQT